MKKSIFSLAVLTLAFIFCANSGECKTVNYYYNVQPVPVQQNRSILYNKQNIAFYTANYNNYKYSKKPPKHKKNNKIAYNYNYTPYSYNNYTPYTYNYTYKQPSLLQRIFNL